LLSVPSPASASPASLATAVQKPCFYFSNGFKIPLSAYKDLETTMRSTVEFVGIKELDSPSTIKESGDKLQSMMERVKGEVILGGHSRGGAVSCLATLLLASSGSFEHTKQRALILIDPVDDDKSTVVTALNVAAKKGKVAKFPPCLIISTPFGGKSGYYQTLYTSVCSPPNRDATTFYHALQKLGNCSVNLVTVPNMGHFDVLSLDETTKLPFSGICASDPNSLDKELGKRLVEEVIRDWTQQCLQGNPKPVPHFPQSQEYRNVKVVLS